MFILDGVPLVKILFAENLYGFKKKKVRLSGSWHKISNPYVVRLLSFFNWIKMGKEND